MTRRCLIITNTGYTYANTHTMSDINTPFPFLRPTILSPRPLPGFLLSSTSTISNRSSSFAEVPLATDSSRYTTKVSCKFLNVFSTRSTYMEARYFWTILETIDICLTLDGVCLRAVNALLCGILRKSSEFTSSIWSPGFKRPSLAAAPSGYTSWIIITPCENVTNFNILELHSLQLGIKCS